MATPPSARRVFAPAKINLFLHVTAKRADGFHDLESLVAFAGVGDTLSIRAARKGFSLKFEGPFAPALSGDEDNLVLKAARAVAAFARAEQGAEFLLEKSLPVAAGIGGGSADAGATIRGLASLWGLGDGRTAELMSLAAGVGSDVPVCLRSSPAWMEGRGERVTHLPDLPKIAIVLANPGVSISTADVFRGLVIEKAPRALKPANAITSLDHLLACLADTRNDLEPAARSIAPVIGDVVDALNRWGAVFARMSGSGATCFGLFDSKEKAETAARDIAQTHAEWWVRATEFVPAATATPVPQ